MHLPQLNLLYIFLNSCHWWAILALGRHVRDRKVVYLGETHGEPAVVGLHTAVLDTLVTQVHDFKKADRLGSNKFQWVKLHIVGRRERFRCKSFSLYGTFQSWASGIIKGSLGFSLWTLMYSVSTTIRISWIDSRLVMWRRKSSRSNMTGAQCQGGGFLNKCSFQVGRRRILVGSILSPTSTCQEALQNSKAEGWLCAQAVD